MAFWGRSQELCELLGLKSKVIFHSQSIHPLLYKDIQVLIEAEPKLWKFYFVDSEWKRFHTIFSKMIHNASVTDG